VVANPVWYACPADGHLIRRNLFAPGRVARGDSHCPSTESSCSECASRASPDGRSLARFAVILGRASAPTVAHQRQPWRSRSDLVQWLQHQVRASFDVPASTRLELRATLDRLRDMDAGDTKTTAGWKQLRDAAPKVWNASKPVRDMLMTEGGKKVLGL
jgi:hypothetical protein